MRFGVNVNTPPKAGGRYRTDGCEGDMKRYNLEPRPCPCGGRILPYEFEKPSKFKERKYCSTTCPVLQKRKQDGSRSKAAKEHRQQKDARTPASNRDPVDRFLMGKL